MKKLNFKIKGQIPKDAIIQIDGKPVKFKKNKNNIKVYQHETENTKVVVTINKYLELNGKHWFFWQMFLFFITLFGIFDARAEKKCFVIDCKLEFFVQGDTEIELKFNKIFDGKKAVEVITEANCFESKNQYTIDKSCKKKLKKLKTSKIVSAIFIAVLVAVLIVVLSV